MNAEVKELRAESLLNFGRRHKLPVILQTEVAECGLACLAMMCGYHGLDIDLTVLRRQFPISNQGLNLKRLIDISNELGFSSRALRLEIDAIEKIDFPCIIHWELNHFVVLKSINRNGVLIHDPSRGERKVSRKEFNAAFTGVALELIPSKEFNKGSFKEKLSIKHFWQKIVGLKRNLTHILILTLLLQAFALISPFYMQTVVDDVLLRKDENLLVALAIGFGLLVLIQMGAQALREYILIQFSNKFNIQMSANLFQHLIRLPLPYFSRRHIGDIVSRFRSLDKIRSILTDSLILVFLDGLMAILTLAAMWYYEPTITVVAVSFIFVYAVIRWVWYQPIKRLTEDRLVAEAKENSHFMESVRAIQTVKLFERENIRKNEWLNKLALSMNKGIALSKWEVAYRFINGLLFGLENVVVIYVAALYVMDDVFTIGMLYAFVSYKDRFKSSVDGLITQFIEWKMVGIHLNRLADIVHTKQENAYEKPEFEPDDTTGVVAELNKYRKKEVDIKGRIEVKDLSFKFEEDNKFVFENINFTIEAGECAAIVGPSGSGKTTLLKCLMGLIEPTSGEVLVDGVPVKQINGYRKQISGVMQSDELLSGDIASNIACFAESLDMDRVKKCAQIASIHNEIMAKAMQYHTLIGEMGGELSGGQKQRIVLARAIYQSPKMIFMDEATSHLDHDNEKFIAKNIERMLITRVMIAHRQETINIADKIIELTNCGGRNERNAIG